MVIIRLLLFVIPQRGEVTCAGNIAPEKIRVQQFKNYFF